MSKKNKGILIITPFFAPNIGGVETHLTDLVTGLDKFHYKVFVQTYSPITTQNTSWKKEEVINNINIRRYRWFGKNIFHSVEKYPLLDFFYLTPYLLIRSSFWMVKNHKKIDTIHSHGLNGLICGLVISKLYSKKHITSTHAIYSNSPNSLTAKISSFLFNKTNVVLAQSKESEKQLINWGVDKDKIKQYRYWVDSKKFNDKKNKKHQRFTVIFVSRLIPKKGTRVLLKLAQKMPEISFIMIGSGPEEEYIKKNKTKNINFVGKVNNDNLLDYYSKSDIFIQPALYKEGFTRTIMEAVASGLPVVASNLGTIPEIVDSSVAILVKPKTSNFLSAINELYKNKNKLKQMKSNCRIYSNKHFNSKNLKMITQNY